MTLGKRIIALLAALLLMCMSVPAMAEATLEGNLYTSGLPILKEPETFDVVVAYSSYCLIDWNEKTFYHDRAKETNVNLNFTVLNDWTTQVNLMLASGDLPDMFNGSSVAIDDNIEYFHDLTDLIDQYAPSLTATMAEFPSIIAAMKSADGTIRGLNTFYGALDNYLGTMFWINEDWLNAVNKPIPSTIEEFYDVLVAFRDGDPNGNGQKDEIPLAFNQVQWAGKISNMFGLHGMLYSPTTYVQAGDDFKLLFQPTQPEFYTGLQWLSKLQAEGLLDDEGFSQTNDQYTAKIAQNILGVCARYDPKNFLDGFVPLPPLSNGDVKVVMEGSDAPAGNRNVAITTACENPAALVRYYDHINGDFTLKMSNRFGEKGVYWDYAEDGHNFIMHDYDSKPPEGYEFWDQYVYTHGSPGSVGFSFFSPTDFSRNVSPKTARETAILEQIPYFLKNTYHTAAIEDDLSSEMNLLGIEIDAYVQNFVASSILEGIDDVKWAAHLKTCEALNINRYMELRQMTYDAYLSSIQ